MDVSQQRLSGPRTNVIHLETHLETHDVKVCPSMQMIRARAPQRQTISDADTLPTLEK
jgi:hypothetical protein